MFCSNEVHLPVETKKGSRNV